MSSIAKGHQNSKQHAHHEQEQGGFIWGVVSSRARRPARPARPGPGPPDSPPPPDRAARAAPARPETGGAAPRPPSSAGWRRALPPRRPAADAPPPASTAPATTISNKERISPFFFFFFLQSSCLSPSLSPSLSFSLSLSLSLSLTLTSPCTRGSRSCANSASSSAALRTLPLCSSRCATAKSLFSDTCHKRVSLTSKESTKEENLLKQVVNLLLLRHLHQTTPHSKTARTTKHKKKSPSLSPNRIRESRLRESFCGREGCSPCSTL
jgi:hypothetical protein